MCVKLFIVLLLCHVIGDFYLQTDKICKQKLASRFSSIWTYLHPLIVAGISWLAVGDIDFWLYAIILLLSHFAFDAIKSCFNDTLVAFIIDQVAHIIVLMLVVYLWTVGGNRNIPDYMYFMNIFWPEYALCLLVLVKPSNIFIKKVLAAYQIQVKNSNKIGALIGSLERLITFLLIASGQFSAVGFLVAAKSVLRFKDTQTEKSEYVLAGTLLSFGVAIVIGLITYNEVIG